MWRVVTQLFTASAVDGQRGLAPVGVGAFGRIEDQSVVAEFLPGDAVLALVILVALVFIFEQTVLLRAHKLTCFQIERFLIIFAIVFATIEILMMKVLTASQSGSDGDDEDSDGVPHCGMDGLVHTERWCTSGPVFIDGAPTCDIFVGKLSLSPLLHC